jgi:hypothetical protein
MNEFVKRVSDAILNTPNASDYAELVAKNAIRAMMEPTKEMMDAGCADYLSQERQDFRRVPWNGRRMLQAMLRAVLE